MGGKEPDRKTAAQWPFPFKEAGMNVETVLPAARNRLVRISEASRLTQAAALFV